MTATIGSPSHTANQLGLGLLRQPAMVLSGRASAGRSLASSVRSPSAS